MANSALIISISIFWLASFAKCYGGKYFHSIEFLKAELSRKRLYEESKWTPFDSPVSIGPQDGLKESDKVQILPGQPEGVDFDQYSGYVTVDPNAGRALFYYFVESPQNSSSKPLVLWLNGGPGCSSLGNGAMMELGPFRVNKDGKTLSLNIYSWNTDANIIFLESPAGVGFSYSNTTSDYHSSGDSKTAQDSYTFLFNWLERFPEYKTREFFITGENYAGHYATQLASTIIQNNKNNSQTKINLKGIAIGNANIDFETTLWGIVDFYWTHALMSDELHYQILLNCNFSSANVSDSCSELLNQATTAIIDINTYDIYAPACNPSFNSSTVYTFDPCSAGNYIKSYLNNPQVQKALHANVTAIPHPWEFCSEEINYLWKEALTVLPIIQQLMSEGIRMWIYSGDTDGDTPVTSSRYSINKLGIPVSSAWQPWYAQGEVGGYVVGYQNLTFVTVRGSGQFVPSYQPARALVLFSSFIQGNFPTPS